ncbi:WD40 repeat domain-containing serine/threonine protein kinase [Catellatospora tritici]|uniref:WD40 repeat domain-containing serine/threonine protein kinase n=1 Tax=Catellatospora tritici TaxID=2851566 RepID=UPI001C2D7170|nr:serine/threonine-protein kinase [Catellatospora tritici]MBV1851273.1 serine/threonine protein kinase [Catellatospora tritici]
MSPDTHPAAAGTWQVGDVIAELYRVTKVHEHGGMGLVYRVHHLGWNVDLALKSPRPQWLRTAEDQQRFVDEAQAWISLGLHPHVCAAHYVRAIDGVPRVFAEYVPGGSLREAIDDGRLYEGGPDEVLARLLDLAVQIAWGLAHAHRRGLVHQDVKPANVLLDESGTAKVTDFGLSRVGASAGRTDPARPGVRADPGVGTRVSAGGLTPDYASPEQAAGLPLSRRTDVWSYAVSVFELFTGGVAWSSGPSADVALAEYLHYGPDDPAAPRMPAALAELLRSCLLDDPAARPGDLAEVADTLAAVYATELGRAYPRTVPAEADLRGDELNNRGLSLLDLDDAAAADDALRSALEADPHHLEAVFNASMLGWRRGELTDDEVVAAVAAARATRPEHWLGAYLLAQVHLERGDLDAALPLLAEAARQSPDDPQFAELLSLAHTGELAAGSTERPITGGAPDERGGMTGAHIGQDGRVVLTALVDVPPRQRGLRVALFGGEPRRPTASSVGVHFTDGGRAPLTLPQGAFAHHFAVHPDDRLAAIGGSGDDAVLWDLDRGVVLHRLPGHGLFLTALRFNADGRVLASGSSGGSIRLWDPVGGQRLLTLTGHEREVHGLAWSADGSRLASVSSDRTLRLWDPRTGRCTAVLPHPDRVSALELSPDGRLAVTGDYRGVVRIWELDPDGGGVCRHESQGHRNRVVAAAAAGAGRFLTGGEDGILRLWDAAGGRCLRTIEAHREAMFRALTSSRTVHVAVCVSVDGRLAHSTGNDALLRSWGLPTGYTAALQVCRPRPVSRLHEFDARFQRLLGDAEQALGEGRVPAALEVMRQARAVPGHENAPRVVAAWQRLARSCVRTGLRGARLVHRITLVEPGSQRYWTPRVSVSADGRRALTSSPDDAMVLWDLATGRVERRFDTPEHRISVETLALSADARLAVAVDGYRRLLVWDLHGDDEPRLLGKLPSTGSRVCLDRSGRYALTATGALTVLRRWDLATGRELAAFHGRERLITSSSGGSSRMEPETLHGVCLSGDGQLALAAAQDGDVLRWNAVTGQPLGRLRGHDQRAECVAISPDGRFALSGAWDRTVRYWDLERGRCVRVLSGHTQPVDAVGFTGDGAFAVGAGRDHAVRVWRLGDGACVRVLDGHDGPVAGVGLDDEGWLAVAITRESLSMWDLDWELAFGPAAGQRAGLGRWFDRLRSGG